MPDQDLSMYTEQDLLRDPQFDQATLGQLATARPDLRPAVLAHPNCYPALADWLRAHGVQAASAPQAETPPAQPAYGQAPDAAAAEAQNAQSATGYGQQSPYGQQGASGQPPARQQNDASYGAAAQPSAAPQQQWGGQPGYPPQAAPGAAGAPQRQPQGEPGKSPYGQQPAPGQPSYAQQPTQGGQPPYAQQPTAGQQQPERPGPISPDQWAEDFRQRAGRDPSTAEYQAAVAAGQIGQPRQRDESWEKVSAGAQQMASGAKDFFQQRVAPAAQGAASDFQKAVNEKNTTPMAKLVSIAGFVLPALALLSIIPIFLPAVSVSAAGMSQSVNLWESGGDGVLLLVVLLLVIAASVVAIVMKATWARITAAALGMLAAVIGIIDSIAVFSGAGEAAGIGLGVSADVGVGVYLLLILSILMLAAGIAMVMPTQKKQPRSPQPYPVPGQPGAAAFGQQPGQQYPGQRAVRAGRSGSCAATARPAAWPGAVRAGRSAVSGRGALWSAGTASRSAAGRAGAVRSAAPAAAVSAAAAEPVRPAVGRALRKRLARSSGAGRFCIPAASITRSSAGPVPADSGPGDC